MTNHLITETPDDGDAAYDAMIDAQYDDYDVDYDDYASQYDDDPSPYDGTYSEC
jgi:hypothetical protein